MRAAVTSVYFPSRVKSKSVIIASQGYQILCLHAVAIVLNAVVVVYKHITHSSL